MPRSVRVLETLSIAVLLLASCEGGGGAGGGGADGAPADTGKEGSGKTWFEERPPALACEPAPPAGVDPALGVSFDPGHMLCVDLQMAPDDYELLKADTLFGPGLGLDGALAAFGVLASQCGAAWPNEYPWYRARVTVDGVPLDQVGVRGKGFIGSLFSTVPAFKIKTDKYVDFQHLGDTERITLNNNAGDATHLAACLLFEIFAAAGHPAPRCNLANVMVNGEPLGPYTHVEAVKRRFLERAFGDSSGSLYEGAFTDFVEAWLPRFDVKTGSTDTTFAPLRAVAVALRKPDAELVDALEPLLNIDRFITYWALEVLLGHGDGYNNSRNNFYVYFDPADGGRAVFIPWGIDKTPNAAVQEPLGSFLNAEIPRRLSRIPLVATLMQEEIERLVTEVWDEDALLASVDRYGALVKTAQESDEYDASVESLRDWVRTRPEAVAVLLAAGLPAGAAESSPCAGGGKDGKD